MKAVALQKCIMLSSLSIFSISWVAASTAAEKWHWMYLNLFVLIINKLMCCSLYFCGKSQYLENTFFSFTHAAPPLPPKKFKCMLLVELKCLPTSPNSYVSWRLSSFWTNFLLTWPLIPVRQPCAWVMLWDRHVDIRLRSGPMQGQLSSREEAGRRREQQRPTCSRIGWQNPRQGCFSFFRWALLKMKWEVWCMGNRPGAVLWVGPTGRGPPNELAHLKRLGEHLFS